MAGSDPGQTIGFVSRTMKEMMGFWDHAGKEQVGLVHLLVCAQDEHFLHQDGTYKFSAAQRQERTLFLTLGLLINMQM